METVHICTILIIEVIATILTSKLAQSAQAHSIYSPELVGDFHHIHQVVMDERGDYHLHWEHQDDYIIFECQVRTRGYVGLGLTSSRGTMAGADMMIGWVKDGSGHILDGHIPGKHNFQVDIHQDWQLLKSYENNTHTVLQIRRKLITCDTNDRDITRETIRVLYAWHEEDPNNDEIPTYHGISRGVKSLLLLDSHMRTSDLPPNTQTFDLRNPNVSVPEYKSAYWCQMFSLPDLDRKHHIIKFEPVINSGQEGVVHHILMYACYHNVPPRFHAYGQFCSSAHMPNVVRDCMSPLMAWATGAQAFVLPLQAGFSIGTDEDPKLILMETHFHNPKHAPGLMDNSGIRIYYSSSLRANDAGLLAIGHTVSLYMIIPPQQPAFKVYGYCAPDCLSEVLDGRPDGIHAFGVLLHSHMLGTGVQTRHFRNGQELPPLASDMSYDYNYQEARYIPYEVNIQPGDYLMTECIYNSMSRENITQGGHTMANEMCMSYVLYYPRMPLTYCSSTPQAKDILGVSQITHFYEIEGIVMFPKSLRGRDVLDVMAQDVQWRDPDVAKEYQHIVTSGSVVARCLYYHSNGSFQADMTKFTPREIRHPYLNQGGQCNSVIAWTRLTNTYTVMLVLIWCAVWLAETIK